MHQLHTDLDRQEVRFELDEAQRKLENIGTLSGRYLAVADLHDTSTPRGHLVPGMVQNIIICKELLSGYEGKQKSPMTFADLKRTNPSAHDTFYKAIQEVRVLEREIQLQIAQEMLGHRRI